MTLKEKVFSEVLKVPFGKVVYYGQIANLVGVPAQIVGFVMSGMSQEEMEKIPWQRVVAKTGYISSLKLGLKGILQKEILQKEGVEIRDDYVDMEKFLFELN